ncbi:serine-rich adhesin for platelets-like isoform X2 [Dunckerocampus dactyliophorus]|uniref:serine-rich adhesin for platelets-like isoform X2 n=1 Tax=Dunckerocampus dactyliophorus TaxID=161453 RepID=UPI0024070634|nr:serine-rich adhesin for platelets-like isoform X2 [Dunckerocampus dactyliophorus]
MSQTLLNPFANQTPPETDSQRGFSPHQPGSGSSFFGDLSGTFELYPRPVTHCWPELSTVPSNEAILGSTDMNVGIVKGEVQTLSKPLHQLSHQSIQGTEFPPLGERSTSSRPLDPTRACYGGDSFFNNLAEAKPDYQSIPGLNDCDHRMSDEFAAPHESSPPKYSSESATGILLRFGLEKEDMEVLLSYPEDQITPASLPFILRQIRIQKAKKAAAPTTATVVTTTAAAKATVVTAATATATTATSATAAASTAATAVSATAAAFTATAASATATTAVTTDKFKVLIQPVPVKNPAGTDSLKHFRAVAESNTLDRNTSQAASFQDQRSSSSSLNSVVTFVAPKSPDPVHTVQSCSLTGKDTGVQQAASKIIPLKELEVLRPPKPKSQSSITPCHRVHSSRPSLLLIRCDDNNDANGPRKSQDSKDLQQRMPDKAKQPSIVQSKQEQTNLEKPHRMAEKNQQMLKTQPQSSITPCNRVHSSRPSLLLIRCDDNNDANGPRKSQDSKDLQQRMLDKAKQPSIVQPKQEQTGLEKPHRMPEKNQQMLKKQPHTANKQQDTPDKPQDMSDKHLDASDKQDTSNKQLDTLDNQQDTSEKPVDSCSKRVQPICSSITKVSCPSQPLTAVHPSGPSPSGAPPSGAPLLNALPTAAKISDYAAAVPRVIPAMSRLYNKGGLGHQNSSQHLASCTNLGQNKPASTSQKSRRLSSSPRTSRCTRRSYSSSSSDDHRRSRSRSCGRSSLPTRSKKRWWSPERRRRYPHTRRLTRRSLTRSPASSSDSSRSRSRSKKKRWSPERRRRSLHASRLCHRSRSRPHASSSDSYRSRCRSRDKRYSSAGRRRRTSTQRRSPKKCSSPGTSRDRRASSRSSTESRSSPRRSQDAKASLSGKSSSAEYLAKKVLEKSAIQSLSNQTDLETVVKTLAPALLAELIKMKSFSSLVPSSSLSADKKKDVTKASSSSSTKDGCKSPPPTTVRLKGIWNKLSRGDVESAAENFGKTKSVVLLRAKGEAIVCFEREDAAKKMMNIKNLRVKDIPVSVVRQTESISEETDTCSTSSKRSLHEMPALLQQSSVGTSMAVHQPSTPDRTFPKRQAKVSKAKVSVSKAIEQVQKTVKGAEDKGPVKIETLAIKVNPSGGAVKEKEEQSKCSTEEQCKVEVSSDPEAANVGPASVTELPHQAMARTEEVSNPLPPEPEFSKKNNHYIQTLAPDIKSSLRDNGDEQKTNVEDGKEVAAESCQINKDDHNRHVVETSAGLLCKEDAMEKVANQVIVSVEERPTSTENPAESEHKEKSDQEVSSPSRESKTEEHEPPKKQQARVKDHNTSAHPEAEQKRQVIGFTQVQHPSSTSTAGRRKSTRGKTQGSSVKDEETTFHIFDSVDAETVQEELSITTRSSTGKNQRLPKKDAFSEKRDEEELTTPTRKRTRTSQKTTREETPTKKTEPVLKKEVKSRPAPRGKGRRGRPKKDIQATKSEDACLAKREQNAGGQDKVRFLDSVEEGMLHDHNSPKENDITDSLHEEEGTNEITDSLDECLAEEELFDGNDDKESKDEALKTSQCAKRTQQGRQTRHILFSSKDNTSLVTRDNAGQVEEAEPEEAAQPNWRGRAKKRSRLTSVVRKRNVGLVAAKCVVPNFGLPSFKPNNPLGQEFLRCGYFCDICSTFYQHEITMQDVHCSSRGHYNHLKKYYQKLEQKASG